MLFYDKTLVLQVFALDYGKFSLWFHTHVDQLCEIFTEGDTHKISFRIMFNLALYSLMLKYKKRLECRILNCIFVIMYYHCKILKTFLSNSCTDSQNLSK